MNIINNNVVLTDEKSTIHDIYLFYKDYKPKIRTYALPIIGGIIIGLFITLLFVLPRFQL